MATNDNELASRILHNLEGLLEEAGYRKSEEAINHIDMAPDLRSSVLRKLRTVDMSSFLKAILNRVRSK